MRKTRNGLRDHAERGFMATDPSHRVRIFFITDWEKFAADAARPDRWSEESYPGVRSWAQGTGERPLVCPGISGVLTMLFIRSPE